MQYYRVYFLGSDGQTEQTREIVCADNEEALRRLASFNHPRAAELWLRGRRIGRREPIPAAQRDSGRLMPAITLASAA